MGRDYGIVYLFLVSFSAKKINKMKVIHKTTKQEFNLSIPKYTRALFRGCGYLVMGVNSVWFIEDGEGLYNLREVTDDFEILD